MKSRIFPVAVVLLATLIGYVLSNPLAFHICSTMYQFSNHTGCLDDSIKGIGYPLYNFALYILPITIILIFVPREIFKSWLKFAVWALPLAFLYIATTPVSWSGIGLNFSSFYRDDAARLMGGVFSVVSAFLVIYKFIAARARRSVGH